MKKTASVLILIAFYSCINDVQASLKRYINSSGQIVVYDDACHRAWMQDMSETSMFYWKSYQEMVEIASSLNEPGNEYYGLKGWHIATDKDMLTLLQNPLHEIPYLNFKGTVFGNTEKVAGLFTKRANFLAPIHECYFMVVRLGCCEPYDSLSGMPYTDLIEFPGPGNDIFFYAAPFLEECNPGPTYLEGTWVVTSLVSQSSEGNLVPAPNCFQSQILGRTVYLCLFQLLYPLIAVSIIGLAGWLWFRSRKKSRIVRAPNDIRSD